MVISILEQYISNQYLRAFVIVLLFFVISEIIYWIFKHIFLKLSKKTKTNLDNQIVEAVTKPSSLFFIFLGLRLSITQLVFSENITKIIYGINNTVLILIVGVIASRILTILLNEWSNININGKVPKIDKNLSKFFKKIAYISVYILIFIYILGSVWGVQIGPLLASLGVIGIAVALALQNTLGNVFGGVSLLIDKNLSEGDMVELEDGKVGTVLDIGFRSTKIKTFDNEILVVPNSMLSNSILKNYAKPNLSERVVVPFSVAYGSNIEKVKKLVMMEIKKIKSYIPEPEPFVRFTEMGDSSLNFKVYFWVEDYIEKWIALDEANTKIYNALNKAKISIPFPQRDVHIKKR